MIIMKFGGTSVQDAKAINQVVDIVSSRLADQPVVVVSAMAGVTDALLRIARISEGGKVDGAATMINDLRGRHIAVAQEICRQGDALHAFSAAFVEHRIEQHFDELQRLTRGAASSAKLSPCAQDAILSLGEQLSSLLVTAAFAARRVPVELVDARQLIITDENFSSATPSMSETEDKTRRRLLPLIESGSLIVTQGFIGATREGGATTLGRGGSDYSAAILGAAIGAEAIEIWTDVDGMMTADPRIVPEARRLDEISFDEAAELAWFGAKVLHPSTVAPAVARNIPIRIYNTHNRMSPGTRIVAQAQPSPRLINSIAVKRQVATLTVSASRAQSPCDFLPAIFEIFKSYRLQPDAVTTSSAAASFVLPDDDALDAVSRDLSRIGEVTLERNKAIVCIVGDGLKRKTQAPAELLMVLSDIEVSMISCGSSAISLVCVIHTGEAERAVRSLHGHFFAKDESHSKYLQVYKRIWTKETSDQRGVALQ